jgi:hypothetical protein
MHYLRLLILMLASSWPVYHLIMDANKFANEQHTLTEISIWCTFLASYVVVAYGKRFIQLLVRLLRDLSNVALRAAQILERSYSNWDRNFSRPEDSLAHQKQVPLAPIKDSYFTSTQPAFPVSIVVTFALTILLAIAVFTFSSTEKDSSFEQTATIVKTISKGDRFTPPASFADRFIVPNGCQGCGGPEVDLVPMPRPRPLLRSIPLPRTRPH